MFLPLAEKSGLIKEIDIWVMKQAIKQSQIWQEKNLKPIKMAINLTPLTLIDKSTVSEMFDQINMDNFDPSYFEIEITETTSFFLESSAIDIINRIRSYGISVALDDFGVDYSSLSRLHNLAIDHMKIDKKFIDIAVHDIRSQKVLKNIIRLGTDLGLELTMEGVETLDQVELLKEIGCYQVQGYYYYKPMPSEEIESILRKKE